MSSTTHAYLFALVAVLSIGQGARAEPGAVLVSGTASARQQDIAARAVATAVRAAGWSVAGKTYGAADATTAADCLRKPGPWRCLSAILRDERIQRVAVVSVDPKPGKAGATDTVITERLVISNIDSLFVTQRFCDHCTEDKLAELAAELTKELIDRAAVGSGRTVLAIRSTPRGARAYVDASLVGVTDTSINVVPGTHTITVELDEHRTDTRHVQVDEDTTREVAFSLRTSRSSGTEVAGAVPISMANARVTRRSRLVPGAIAGVGLAVFTAGVVLFALDEDPVTRPDRRCVAPLSRHGRTRRRDRRERPRDHRRRRLPVGEVFQGTSCAHRRPCRRGRGGRPDALVLAGRSQAIEVLMLRMSSRTSLVICCALLAQRSPPAAGSSVTKTIRAGVRDVHTRTA